MSKNVREILEYKIFNTKKLINVYKKRGISELKIKKQETKLKMYENQLANL